MRDQTSTSPSWPQPLPPARLHLSAYSHIATGLGMDTLMPRLENQSIGKHTDLSIGA